MTVIISHSLKLKAEQKMWEKKGNNKSLRLCKGVKKS